MSGAGVLGLGVIAVVGGGVLVASRMATAGTGLLGAGLGALGDRMNADYQRWQRDQQAIGVWECAARTVVDRNSRIAVLRAHAAGDSMLMAGLPAEFVLSGQPVEDLTAWSTTTDAALDAVEEALADRAHRAVRAFLVSVLRPATGSGGPAPGTIGAAEALRRYRELRQRDVRPVHVVEKDLCAVVERILSRLAPDVTDADRADVLAAAADMVLRRAADRFSQLEELRVRVRKANVAAKVQREAAIAAATYLQALAGSPDAALREELVAVVASRRMLDPDLNRAAAQRCARVRAEEELAYIRRCMISTLESLGYAVDADFSTYTGDTNRLRLVRDDWTEHVVGVVLDGTELRTSVIRTAARGGDDSVRVDVDREEQWCESFARLQAELADAGLGLELTHLAHPGERPVPVAARHSRRKSKDVGHARSRDGRR